MEPTPRFLPLRRNDPCSRGSSRPARWNPPRPPEPAHVSVLSSQLSVTSCNSRTGSGGSEPGDPRQEGPSPPGCWGNFSLFHGFVPNKSNPNLPEVPSPLRAPLRRLRVRSTGQTCSGRGEAAREASVGVREQTWSSSSASGTPPAARQRRRGTEHLRVPAHGRRQVRQRGCAITRDVTRFHRCDDALDSRKLLGSAHPVS